MTKSKPWRCWFRKHTTVVVTSSGHNLFVVQCSRCGVYGLVHSVETPDGRFLALSRERAEQAVSELDSMREGYKRFARGERRA